MKPTDEEIRVASLNNSKMHYVMAFSEELHKDADIDFRKGIDFAFEWMREQMDKCDEPKPIWIPYQVCPICNGQGRIVADGFTSSVYQDCPTCNGLRIIMMGKLLPTPPIKTEAK
jgi:hypothetical protein